MMVPRNRLLIAIPAVMCALPDPLWLRLVFPVVARVVTWLLTVPSQLQWAIFCPILVASAVLLMLRTCSTPGATPVALLLRLSVVLLLLRTCSTPGATPVALLLRLQVQMPSTAVRLYLVPALPAAWLRSLVVCHPLQF